MSSLDDKLAAPVTSAPGRARQTLKQLRTRWGADFGQYLAEWTAITVRGMTVERWVRLDDGSRGEQSNYELKGSA